MINSISDTLRLAGQLAPIVQPLKSSTVEQTATKVPTLPSALGAYRFSAFSRWAKACEIQHRISSEQIVLQTLKRFEKVLIALQNGLKQQQTAEQLEPLRQLLINHQASYLGIPLFDQQLNRYRFGMTQVKFQLQGVQLLAQHQHSEQLQLNLPFAGRTVAVGLFFDANSHESQQLTMINQQLSMYDIHCHRGTDTVHAHE